MDEATLTRFEADAEDRRLADPVARRTILALVAEVRRLQAPPFTPGTVELVGGYPRRDKPAREGKRGKWKPKKRSINKAHRRLHGQARAIRALVEAGHDAVGIGRAFGVAAEPARRFVEDELGLEFRTPDPNTNPPW